MTGHQLEEMVSTWINGNRKDVVREILSVGDPQIAAPGETTPDPGMCAARAVLFLRALVNTQGADALNSDGPVLEKLLRLAGA